MGARDALIIATGTYVDEGLRQLRSPAQDAEALARVLGDPEIGGFTVRQQVDATEAVLRRALFQFFDDRRREDVLLVHVSCHGVKDDDGQLYFATTDTTREALEVTAVSASFVNEQMERCRARSIVLLLDCCYAGAFAPGSKGDAGVHLKEKFSGHGRAILTASNALEYSWEGKELSGQPQPSVFTAATVEGLSTGAADLDGDGRVSIHELHEYVAERMLAAKPRQTPLKWELGVEGGLYIARNPHPSAALPEVVLDALEHPLPGVRAGVVTDLATLLDSHDRRTAAEARAALERLQHDDSVSVRAAAAAALSRGTAESGGARAALGGAAAGQVSDGVEPPEQRRPEPPKPAPQPEEEERPAPQPPPPDRRLLAGAALAAVLLVLLGTALITPGADDETNASPSPTGSQPTATPTDAGPEVRRYAVSVPATAPWTDTGVDLAAGDRVDLRATGELLDDVTNPSQVYGPAGEPDPSGQHSGDPHEANHAALVARVVPDGQVFEAGAATEFPVRSPGRLHLGINDGRFDDNAGAYEVQLTVTSAVP